MKSKVDYTLYLVTDRTLLRAPTLELAVEQAIAGGCTVVQLREKTACSLDFYHQALRVKAVTDRCGVPLIINDRLDIALAVDAAGVHVGQEDLPAAVVRHNLGANKILGVSASSLAEAVAAQRDGADYLGLGAMFSTDTKRDAQLVSLAELHQILTAVSIPSVLIGGINLDTLPLFAGSGVSGIAVVSALLCAPDIAAAARALRHTFTCGQSALSAPAV